MAIYTIKRLLTITDCDTALRIVSKAIEDLAFKKKKLERRLEVHHRITSKAITERSSLEIDVAVFSAGLLAAGEGFLAQTYRYKIARAQCRIQFLDLRLEKYNAPALLMKELKLHQAAAALQEAAMFKATLEAHRAELIQMTDRASRKPALLVPFISTPGPVPGSKEVALQWNKRFLKRRTGKG